MMDDEHDIAGCTLNLTNCENLSKRYISYPKILYNKIAIYVWLNHI